MSPVFSHGRLRLYLLKLLEESPRHGYDIIRLLEDRFLGLYAPSPGTIYPRLARLEERRGSGVAARSFLSALRGFHSSDMTSAAQSYMASMSQSISFTEHA